MNSLQTISTAQRVRAKNRKYDDLTEVVKLYKGPPQGISEDLFSPHTA